MRMRILAACAAMSLSLPVAAWACPGDGDQKGAQSAEKESKELKTLTVAQVAEARKAAKAAVVLDANSPDFRAKNGVIPGATLLTSINYDPTKELPAAKDSKLVFYCANNHCGASHMAANKAVEAGYTDVAVMPDGLMGWKKAGQPVENNKPQS